MQGRIAPRRRPKMITKMTTPRLGYPSWRSLMKRPMKRRPAHWQKRGCLQSRIRRRTVPRRLHRLRTHLG